MMHDRAHVYVCVHMSYILIKIFVKIHLLVAPENAWLMSHLNTFQYLLTFC